MKISPVILRLLDGLVGANITRAANISIRFSTNDILPLKFYITKLDSTSMFIFGHNWLHRYNPSIDWSAGQILYFQQLPQSVPSSARSGPNISSEMPASRPSASVPKPSVSSDSSSASNPSVPLGYHPFLLLTPPLMRAWLVLRATLFSQSLSLIPIPLLVLLLTPIL